MKNKKLFEKAYSRLNELYGGDYSTPDVVILSRFYREKMILGESELYMRYLDFLGKVRARAEDKGEHIFVRGTAGSSFIAYLLGATDINPLPRHVYCPHCHHHQIQFNNNETPFHDCEKCMCGAVPITDGHNIPFESNIKSVLSGYIQLSVSYSFFDEVEEMIRDEMWDQAIITLRNGDLSPTWFCFQDEAQNEDGNYRLNGNRELFSKFPRITLVPDKMLDKYRELEKATGFKMKDIGAGERSEAFFQFMDGNIDGVPYFNNNFMREIWDKVKPLSYDDLLKLIGLAHSTNVWKYNAEWYYDDHKMVFQKIPAYREDLFQMISEHLYKKGIYDTGLAYEVTEKARRGYYAENGGMDEDTFLTLMNLGIDLEYISFIEEVNYMFSKAQGVAYLRDAIRMMFYKNNFNQEYSKIILGN